MICASRMMEETKTMKVVLVAGPRISRDKIVSIGASIMTVESPNSEAVCDIQEIFNFKVCAIYFPGVEML